MPNPMPESVTEMEYKAGRPFVFTDPGALALKIQEYFDLQDPHIIKTKVVDGEKIDGNVIFVDRQIMTKQKVYTLTGLARHLGVSRDTIRNYRYYKHYSQDMDQAVILELIRTIEDAVQRVEEFNEAQLHKNGISNGVKFNLTNNFGWEDKQTVENKSYKEELDDLDDPKTARDDMAASAAAEIDKTTAQPPQPEKPVEPGPAPTQ